MERELPVPSDRLHHVGPGDLDQAPASRLLLTEHDPAEDHLTGTRITDGVDRDLKAELSAELDLDVPDMPGTMDPPGPPAHEGRRQHGQDHERQGGQPLAERTGHGEHPCLPEACADTSGRQPCRSRSIR